MASKGILKPCLGALALMLTPVLATAQDVAPAENERVASAAELPVPEEGMLDVEELNDNVDRYEGKQVSVAGEIEEYLDGRAFVMESGGIFDDEITVVLPEGGVEGLEPWMLSEDSDIIVTGTLRSIAVDDVGRELGWDLDPGLETELADTREFLVAKRINRQFDDRFDD